MLANQEIYLLAPGTQWMVESFGECDRIRCRCSSDFSQAAQKRGAGAEELERDISSW